MSNKMEGTSGPGVRVNGPVVPPSSSASSSMGAPLSPQELQEEQQSSLVDVSQMWIKFAKTFAIILPIYVLGYFEFSFSWVLVGLAALFYWRRNHGNKDYRINRAIEFLEHEDKAVKQNMATTELPPWVHYPDVERVEWLNKTVKQMWPFICQFVDKLFRDTIEPAVQSANPYLGSFCFSKIDMGDKPLRVNGVKVYTENVDKRQVIMDLQISFVGNTEIDVDIKKYYCRAGIKSIQALLYSLMAVGPKESLDLSVLHLGRTSRNRSQFVDWKQISTTQSALFPLRRLRNFVRTSVGRGLVWARHFSSSSLVKLSLIVTVQVQ
uniref:extended synaptotagmin-2-A n=1 Tax=Solea senegalensis TaxID=28829 RepID=UPI001CD8C0F1|nr:extended synaptotagmin-2-A [Solea senegalensis]